MSTSPALVQARLGEGLRRLPSELLRADGGAADADAGAVAHAGVDAAAVDDSCSAGAGSIARADATAPGADDAEAARMARELEQAAPGISLMLQLRARLFDDALADARRRGFSCVVATGCGFDERRLETCAAAGLRVWHVERPAVLAALRARGRTSVHPLATDDPGTALWWGPGRDELALAREGTFFLVQNGSFWPAADGMTRWLRAFSVAAATGSEALLNVFVAGDASAGVAGEPTDRDAEREDLKKLGLRVVGVFDSRDLQRRYLGFDDMLVRERYLWVAAERSAVTTRSDCTGPNGSLDGVAGPTGRQAAAGPWHLRSCTGSQNGVRRTTALRGVPARCGPDAAATAAAIAALRGADARQRRQAAAALRCHRPNRAARHLEAMLFRAGDSWDVVLVGQEPLYIAARRADAARRAPALAAQARLLLRAIAHLLRVGPIPRVMIDVTSDSAATPVVLTGADAPYTLVRVPRSRCERPVLAHELAHVLAMARSRWLSEGLAVWVQRRIAPGPCFPDDGEATDDETPGIVVPLESRLRPCASVASLTRGRVRHDYREAAEFVDFFVRRFTLQRFLTFFRACTAMAASDELLAECRAIGCASPNALERCWRTAMAVATKGGIDP